MIHSLLKQCCRLQLCFIDKDLAFSLCEVKSTKWQTSGSGMRTTAGKYSTRFTYENVEIPVATYQSGPRGQELSSQGLPDPILDKDDQHYSLKVTQGQYRQASCHSPTLGNIPDQRLFQFMLILTKPAAVPLIFIHMFLRINEKKSHLKRLTILLNIPVQLRRDLLDQLTEPTISLIAQTGHC
ncbi:hypothetical protein MAR_031503 [Mya arenaria]|uniref:Uncharacterized protein n=1 Tax=Mya arenaria TaxID=6604 RepID=A0ABY7F814_MYAAR|nr:hypothetical protein MAR_031503 [Mya arenaria]